jgi:hypothetical protein
MVLPYINQRDSFSQNNLHTPVSANMSFDTSFSSCSSQSPWEMSGTPSPTRRVYDPLDMEEDGLSSSTSSARTSMAGSPFQQQHYALLNSEQHQMYSTPSHRILSNHGLMSFDMPYNDSLYSPFEDSDYRSDMTCGSSPTRMMSHAHSNSMHTPQGFINPSQTFLEPFQQPLTPATTPGGMMGDMNACSPVDDFSMSNERQIPYFFSPVMAQQTKRSPYNGCPMKRSPSSMPALASSTALHRVQDSGRVTKRSNQAAQNYNADGIQIDSVVEKGLYHCNWLGCKSKGKFTRPEHLKRHMKIHTEQKDVACPFCKVTSKPKYFQRARKDNLKAHIILHTNPEPQKGKRTKYFPEAAAYLRELEASIKEDKLNAESEKNSALKPAAEIAISNSRRNATRIAAARF